MTAALWEKSGLDDPAMTMGHSLGEYMALVASRAISARECYALVEGGTRHARRHARKVGRHGAVLGLSADDVARLIEPVQNVWVANLNSPTRW